MNRTHRDGDLARRGRIIALASVLAVAPMVTGFPQVSAQARAHPVKSQLREVGFVPSSGASLRAARAASSSRDPILTARSVAVAPAQSVAGEVNVVGVTWPRGAVTAGDQYQIRTLTGATWSQWQSLDVEDGGPDRAEASAAATGGTSPYVVTGASKFEVRSLSTDTAVPATAKVEVVDPGTSPADTIQQAPGAAAAAAAKPVILPRSAWGANESLRRAAPSYGQIKVGFVHHTASANGYSADSVPAIIRGMYTYHVQSLNWSDIGYNFLVDRFGRTWEGRYGGVSRPVIGAQTMNMNSVSMGVSAIGEYDIAPVPSAMTTALTRILAWKFSVAGIPAIGRVVANSKNLNRISGHRDSYPTACPGRYMYAKLPAIRTAAAALNAVVPPVIPPPVVVRSVIRRDVDRNGAPDALSYGPGGGRPISGAGSLLASATRRPVRSGMVVGTGWNGLRSASISPDLSGDGKADIVAIDPVAGRLRIYRGNGRGGFSGRLYSGTGWGAMTRVLAAGDRNRDGHNDVLATNAAGQLFFYAGNGAGGFRAGRSIGSLGAVGSVTTVGDLTRDGYPDLLATRTAGGALMMYSGASGGGIHSGVVWASGWGSMSPVVGGSDLDGDRYPDVFARVGGAMRTYSTDASGHLVRVISWGTGWAAMTQLSTGVDWNGDRVADLLAVNPASSSGALVLYPGTGLRDFLTRPASFPSVAGADLVRLVGDVNGDGYTDAVARVVSSKALVIRLGQAGSTFAAPRQIGTTGWGPVAVPQIEAAGDYTGDGVPDLLARDSAGNLLVYPLHRDLTFGTRITIGTGFQGMQSVVGVGAFSQDAYGDVIALRAADHALVSFRGTGSGRLQNGPVLATGRQTIDIAQILGVGDYNGDGTADLMARSVAGVLWLYPGNGQGGLTARQPVRGGEGAGHVLG